MYVIFLASKHSIVFPPNLSTLPENTLRFRIDTRSVACELIPFCRFEPARVKPN